MPQQLRWLLRLFDLANSTFKADNADLVIETPDYVYIFEFNLDHPAAEALAQIEARGYAASYAHDARKVYKIGCSFYSVRGRVEEWKASE